MQINRRSTIKEQQVVAGKRHPDIVMLKEMQPGEIRTWVDNQYARPEGIGVKRMFKLLFIGLAQLLQK